jgi:hypothetical protein
MKNCFKIKYHWFLIIGMLFLSNYSIGQTFLSVTDSLVKENGRPFIVRLNPTSSIAQQCTSQTITLNIGELIYLPGSNGPLPLGVEVSPVTNASITVLTISGIVNDGKQGSSLTMDIAMQFKPGTCDGVTQLITATTTNIGCEVISNQAGNITVSSLTPNSAGIQLNLSYNPEIKQPICPRKTVKYNLFATNYGNKGFNLTNQQFHLEIDNCATVIGIYKGGTYVSVNPVISSTGNVKTIDFAVPDLMLSINYPSAYFDIYIMYPCLNGNASDCTSGEKKISATLRGTKNGCGLNFETEKTTTTHTITTSTAECGDVNCSTGGTGGESDPLQITNLYYTLPCPDACIVSYPYVGVSLSFPPSRPEMQNRVAIIDIPAGVNVLSGFTNENSACGTNYTTKYIDAQGNKQSSPFGNSLTRKIELTTTCSITSPLVYFFVYFQFDKTNPPLPSTFVPFTLSYSAEGTKLIENAVFGATTASCNPNVYLVKQVRKSSQLVYENNYNASAIPGEIMTYRQMIYNEGTGDSNNIILDNINPNLIYEGGFKYAYVEAGNIYDPSLLTPLLGKEFFELDGLVKVSVSVPAIGQSGGIVKLSGFNFPCTNKRLFIEYNVRVRDNVVAGTRIPNSTSITGTQPNYPPSQANYITIAAFTYAKSKMFVKCSLANEWNESNINVKNGEVIDFKMQFSNAGSTPIVLSELINLRPQVGDLFEFGSNPRKSTLDINYNCDTPAVFKNAVTVPGVEFGYALNSPAMDRDMLCPPKLTGNTPIWIPSCDGANWLKASFPSNFTLLPGDNVDIIYKGRVTGTVGTAYNSFAFKVGGCNILSTNSNTLAIANDNVGVGCNSCTLTNPYSADMKTLFENLMKNILTRKINGETDTQINGSSPSELLALRPYIYNGGGDKIYNFSSTVNAQNKITSIKFSFAKNSVNDVTFLEEKGLNYNPEVGAVDPSYLRIDTTLYSASNQYLTTCRRTLDDNGVVISDCTSKTQVKSIDFCPSRFCSPMTGQIKTGE